MRVLVFGTGIYYERFRPFLKGQTIVALLDNNAKKQGTIIDGIKVLSPADGIKESYDRILCLAEVWKDMIDQLVDLGVDSKIIYDKNRIADFLDGNLPDLEWGILKAQSISCNRKKLAFVTPAIWGGALNALLNLISVIQGDYNITVIFTISSRRDGWGETNKKTVEMFEHLNITIIADERLYACAIEDLDYIRDYDAVVVNTVTLASVFRKHNIGCPIIWWLHDAETIYRQCNDRQLEKISGGDITIAAVSQSAFNTFKKRNNKFNPVYITPSIADSKDKIERRTVQDHSLTISIIGAIYRGKGQDIFLDAIDRLPQTIKNQCKFLIIGKDEDREYAERIKGRVGTDDRVYVVGELDYNSMLEKYNEIDVVVSASRSEAFGLTIIEGMMMRKLCIVSDACGVVDFIKPYENGLTFRTGHADELAQRIEWVFNNPNESEMIRNSGRKTYKQYFTQEAVRTMFVILIDNVCKKYRNEFLNTI